MNPELELIIADLQKVPFLQGLPPGAIAAMAREATARELAAGEALFQKGDPGDSAYLLRRGWVKIVTADHDGEELVLNQCGPGEVVGEMSLIDREPRSAGVVALTHADVLELKRDTFLLILREEPLLALDMMRNISARLRFATTYIEKVIEWSQRIAIGDYSFALDEIESEQSGIVDPELADEARAVELLTAFFRMIEGIRNREETLRQQLRSLTIDIDESERQELFSQVTGTAFFQKLQASARQLRQQPRPDDESAPPTAEQP